MPNINPARLPGAFLFFTLKTPQGLKFAGLAYDEKIDSTTKLQELQKKYFSNNGINLPYMERFTEITEADGSGWQGKSGTTYGGVFGGPDPPKSAKSSTVSGLIPNTYRMIISPPWPYLNDASSPIRNGVYVSYWNFGAGSGQGMHTSSTTNHFAKGAEVPYMWLYPGNSTNLVPDKAPFVTNTVTEVYLDWYSRFDGALGWDKETISTAL